MRFSLRSLILFSLLAGAAGLLWLQREPWRLDGVLEMTQSEGEAGRHFTFFRNGRAEFEFDFRGRGLLMREKGSNQEGLGPNSYIAYPSMAFSPDFDAVLLGNNDRVSLYDFNTGARRHDWPIVSKNTPERSGLTYELPLLSYAPDGSTVAVFVRDPESLQLMDARSGRVIQQLKTDLPGVSEIRFTPDSKMIELLAYGRVAAFNVQTEARENESIWRAGVYSQWTWIKGDEELVAIMNEDGRVRLANSKSGRVVRELWSKQELPSKIDGNFDLEAFMEQHRHPVQFDHFSSDGRYFFIAQMQVGEVDALSRSLKGYAVHETLTGKCVFQIAVNHDFNNKDFNGYGWPRVEIANGRCVLSNMAGDVRVWDCATWERVAELDLESKSALPAIPTMKFWFIDAPSIKRAVMHVSASGERVYLNGQTDERRARGYLMRRHHPEYWWGLAWTVEFWVVFTVAAMLMWSLARDWRELRRALSNP